MAGRGAVAGGPGADKGGEAKGDGGVRRGGKAGEAWVGGIVCRGGDNDGENEARKVVVGEVDASRKEVPRCVGGACEGGVAGGEGRVCRGSGVEGGGASERGVAKGQVADWEGGVVGGEGGSASGRGVPVICGGGTSCAVKPDGEGVAKGGGGPNTGVAPFLGGVDCGGRRPCSPFDLGCEECPRARGVPPGKGPARAGEDRGVALEPKGREAGFWRPPPALGRLLAAGLGSAVPCCGALFADFLGASVGGRGRALGAARGRPTSAPAARDRREVAGEGAPGEGPEESGDKIRMPEGQRYLRAGPFHCPGTPLLLRSRTSPCPGAQCAPSGGFWGFSSAHGFLSWGPKPLMRKGA